VDNSGNIYVAEAGTNRLLVYDRVGNCTAVRDGLAGPISVATTDNRVLVGSAATSRVDVFDKSLSPLFAIGSGDSEVGRPTAIVVAADGKIYVTDAKAHLIKTYNPDGSRAFSFGAPGSAAGQLNYPTALAIDDEAGRLIVADLPIVTSATGPHEGARLQVFSLDGHYLGSFGGFGVGSGLLIKPLGVATDGKGRVYVADSYQNIIQTFDRDGNYLAAVFDRAHPLRCPVDLAIGKPGGRLFVASSLTRSIEIFRATGPHTLTATVDEHGVIAPAGLVAVADGGDQLFTITPAAGYRVAEVLVDGSPVGPVTSYSFTNVSEDHTISVAFTLDVAPVITAQAVGHGTISPAGAVAVPYRASQTFVITPAPGYAIADVLVDSRPVGAPSSYTFRDVTADHHITAQFSAQAQQLVLAVSGDGMVASMPTALSCPGSCSADFADREMVTLTATAASGAIFAGWGGDCRGLIDECTVAMDQAKNISAAFVPAERIVSFESGSFGRDSLPWMTGRANGWGGWIMQEAEKHEGRYAAMAPPPEAGEMSYLEVSLSTTEAGSLTFWLKTEGRETASLRLLIDGVETGSWLGNREWTGVQFEVPSGKHTFRWEQTGVESSGWLDEIIFPAHEPIAFPVTDIKANTSDGPLSLRSAEQMLVTIGLAPGNADGAIADWWLAAETLYGWFFFNAATGTWQPTSTAALQEPLTDLSTHLEVLRASGLAGGTYTLYFGVDTVPNGVADQAELSQDSAIINISE